MNSKRTRSAAPDTMEACACFNLRKAARAVTQSFDAAIRPTGLNANQLSLLAVLSGEDAITMKRLAAAVVMDRTTLTRNLRPLARQGWVQVEAGADRREREVTLTAAGRRKLAQGQRRWSDVQSRFRQSMGGRRFERFLADLSAVVSTARVN
jgi:DNA-binding MarR family transcriptional regulator